MVLRIAVGVLALGSVVLGVQVFAQRSQLARLDAELTALRQQAPPPRGGGTWHAFGPREPSAAARLTPTADAPPSATARPAPTPPSGAPSPVAPPVPAAPRAPVTSDEIARVESAVLSLLESDRPELREKLRAVVQEEQESREHQQQEQRRERWIARTEARLIELSEATGVNPTQREALLNLLLANRDQIGDVRQNAETPEAITQARETVERLRTEADTQVKELLNDAQYKAYKERFVDNERRWRPMTE